MRDLININLENYVDITNAENKILEQIETLTREKENIIDILYKYQNKYSSYISLDVIATNFNIKTLNLEVANEILNSIKVIFKYSSLPEEEKQETYNIFERLQNRLKENFDKSTIYPEMLETIRLKKEARRKFLEQEYQKYQDIVKQIKSNTDRMDFLEQEKEKTDWEQNIIDAFANEIEKYEKKNINLKEKLNKLKEDKQLTEELALYAKEQNKKLENIEEKNNEQEEEMTENIGFDEKEEQKLEVVEDTKKETSLVPVNNIEPQIEEEITEETPNLEAITPEKPKKVKNKHKANFNLIAGLKKYGGPALGIIGIGIAVVAAISNPFLITSALGAGLVISEAKNHTLKK